jgi:hypothetical protein
MRTGTEQSAQTTVQAIERMYGVCMERYMVVRFSLANNNTVFAVGKNDAVRDGIKRAVHGLLLRMGAVGEKKRITFNSTFACIAPGVKFGKIGIYRACKSWPRCENGLGSSMTPYRPKGSQENANIANY